MTEVLLDTLLDGIRMLPFLLAAYLLIEFLEHRSSEKLQAILVGSGKFGPLGGAFLGAFPQCGFSVAAANFYSGKVITRGTLIAVFLSTSDEAIPVLLAVPGSGKILLKLVAIKVLIGLIAGFIIDYADQKRGMSYVQMKTGEHSELCGDCHCEQGIFAAAVHHTLTVFVFILIVSLLLNSVFYLLGAEMMAKFLMSDSLFQPFIAGLFGLIPNCAASLVLTQLFLSGGIRFGSVVAGLCSGAGIGLAVLFKMNRDVKDSLKLVALLYAIGVGCGILTDIFEV